MMNINPKMVQLLNTVRRSGNPQQMVLNMLGQQAKGNPIAENVLTLAQHNDGKGIETVAKNILKEKGFDFDKEFNSFKNILGFK